MLSTWFKEMYYNISASYWGIIFLCICVTILLYAETRFTRTAIFVNRFPGATGLPILGNFLNIYCRRTEDVTVTAAEYIEKYGRVCRFWAFQKPIIAIAQHSAVEKILASNEHLDKASSINKVKIYFGNGLVTAEVEKWRVDRKQLNAGLKHSLFNGFLSVFNLHSENLIKKLVCQIPGNQSHIFVKEMFPYFGQCTLSAVCETILGKREGCGDKLDDSKVLKSLETGLNGIRIRFLKPYLTLPVVWNLFGHGKMESKYLDPMRNDIVSYISQKIKEVNLRSDNAQEISECSETAPKTIMDILLDPEQPRSAEDIYDHVITMLGAGTDTTASGMNFTLYLLALHPEAQKNVHMELDNIFDNRDDKSVTFSDLSQMKYLEMCIKEAMRIYPPTPLFTRKAQTDIQLDNNLVIPKLCDIVIMQYYLHRDPDIFPDPEVFIPERFTAEESSKRSPYAYIPFGAGIRNCIGQKYAMIEMKVILAHLLRQFSVSTTKSQKELKVVFGIVTELNEEISFTLTSRHPCELPFLKID